jgi:hypothetical protein
MNNRRYFAFLLGFFLGWIVLPHTEYRPLRKYELPDIDQQWPDWTRTIGGPNYAYPPLGYPVYGPEDRAGMEYQRGPGWEMWSR